MHREHGLFICQKPLISSNLFNCLGFLVDIICVRDFIHTGMMYRDHSKSWQMTDALICRSRTTAKSPSLNRVPWAGEALLTLLCLLSVLLLFPSPLFLPSLPTTLLQVKSLTYIHARDLIKEDLEQNDPLCPALDGAESFVLPSCSRGARAAPVPSSAHLGSLGDADFTVLQ